MSAADYRSIANVSGLVRDQVLSPVEIVRACLERIAELNPGLNAFITVTADLALEQANMAAAEIRAGTWRGPLHGIPVGIKDFFDTAGVKTTGAFEPFRNRVPDRDAEVVTRLKEGGAVMVGKTNMHVLGMGTTSVDSCFGPVHNPWNVDYVAGGSSGGSAAAVAAGLCYATIDTDAIGSCRLPAACCGVTGFKPTFGLVSTQGILEGEPLDEETARTLAWIGHTAITGRSAEDVAIVLRVLAKPGVSQRGQLRIGVATNYKASREVKNTFEEATYVFRSLGHETVDKEVPFASATCNLTNIERDRKGITGLMFQDIDVLILPTTTAEPPRIEEVRASGNAQAISPENTFFCNYYGLPAVSLPCGFSGDGLPLGLQVAGPLGSDELVLDLAQSFQQATQWHLKHPIG